MIFDWDDFHQNNHNYPLLLKLKKLNPDFKCTMYAIPGLAEPYWWDIVPDWIELAVHGWMHPHPREAERWTYDQMDDFMGRVHPRFVKGFKAPGWQISDASYQWLLDNDWWVADQDYNDERRPPGLKVYKIRGDSWHGHVQNDCGNGLQETFRHVSELVRNATEFNFCSEVLFWQS